MATVAVGHTAAIIAFLAADFTWRVVLQDKVGHLTLLQRAMQLAADGRGSG